MRNAMIIDPKDNVAVAIEPIAKGTAAVWVAGGKEAELRALNDLGLALMRLPPKIIERSAGNQ